MQVHPFAVIFDPFKPQHLNAESCLVQGYHPRSGGLASSRRNRNSCSCRLMHAQCCDLDLCRVSCFLNFPPPAAECRAYQLCMQTRVMPPPLINFNYSVYGLIKTEPVTLINLEKNYFIAALFLAAVSSFISLHLNYV